MANRWQSIKAGLVFSSLFLSQIGKLISKKMVEMVKRKSLRCKLLFRLRLSHSVGWNSKCQLVLFLGKPSWLITMPPMSHNWAGIVLGNSKQNNLFWIAWRGTTNIFLYNLLHILPIFKNIYIFWGNVPELSSRDFLRSAELLLKFYPSEAKVW